MHLTGAPMEKSIAYSHGKSPEVNDNVYSDISLIDIESGTIKPIAATGAGEIKSAVQPRWKIDRLLLLQTDPVDWSGPRSCKNLFCC